MPIADDVELEEGVEIPYPDLVNLYGCEIGAYSFIGPFTEIQRGVTIGLGTRIQSHSFICEMVDIGHNCFIGHGVKFVNDLHPLKDTEWEKTIVENNVSIGSNATILPCHVSPFAEIGAGAVVTDNVGYKETVKGNPAQ